MKAVGEFVPERVVIGSQAKYQPEARMPHCALDIIGLGKAGRRRVAASFDGGDPGSGAGRLAVAARR